jgi:pimeloyl-ACP methyl ester carboxylesterase
VRVLTNPPHGLKVHELGRSEGPTLVLLHGFTDSGLCWPDAVRRWGGDYRIVALDARGHGESARFDPATSGSNRFDAMVADVVALLEALADERGEPRFLVGHSMGAGVAASVVATRPDLVHAAVLEDPPWFIRSPGEDRLAGQEPVQQWVQQFRDDLDAAVARGRAEQPQWPEIEIRPWGVSKAQLDPSLTDVEQILMQVPWVDDATAIVRPTLLITGGRDEEVIVGPRSRQRLAELGNHHIEVAVVPGAGHTVRRDDADAYHQIVDPWIKEIFTGATVS